MTVAEWPGLEPALNVTASKPGDTANSSRLLTGGVLMFLSDQGCLPRMLQKPGNQKAQSCGLAGTPKQ